MHMDVSNLTPVSQQAAPVAKAGGGTGTQKTASRGKSLPLPGEQKQIFPSADKQQKGNPSTDELRNLVDKTNNLPAVRSSDLRFTIAEGTDIPVIQVQDAKTGELIRQIPSKEVVAIARALEDKTQGMMLKEKV
jgi:flagellar protein FlaG